MATIIVKEGDGHTITVTWKDGFGAPFAPSTVRYRVDCMTTGTERIAWTALATTSPLTLGIPGSANNIVSPANASEVKQVTIQANAGLDDQKTLLAEYVVPNNDFVS
jgi:hypothetical protein